MPNYTGPYYSDGKIQESVEFGRSAPTSALDAESRLHDSAYAHYKDLQHRMAADSIYESRVTKLGGFAKFAGEAVLYGNQTLRAGSNLLEYSKYGLVGLVVGSLINDYHLNDYMMNSDKYKKEVLAYYATDPGWDKIAPDIPPVDYVDRGFGDYAGPSSFSDLVDSTPPKVSVPGGRKPNSTNEVYNPYDVFYRRFGRRRRKKRIKYE